MSFPLFFATNYKLVEENTSHITFWYGTETFDSFVSVFWEFYAMTKFFRFFENIAILPELLRFYSWFRQWKYLLNNQSVVKNTFKCTFKTFIFCISKDNSFGDEQQSYNNYRRKKTKKMRFFAFFHDNLVCLPDFGDLKIFKPTTCACWVQIL